MALDTTDWYRRHRAGGITTRFADIVQSVVSLFAKLPNELANKSIIVRIVCTMKTVTRK